MRRFVKALHLIGLAIFLGSVFGHIAIWATAGTGQASGILILLNTFFILYPVGSELAVAAGQLLQGSLSHEAFNAIAAREVRLGPINLALVLVPLFIAVVKPGFGSDTAKA